MCSQAYSKADTFCTDADDEYVLQSSKRWLYSWKRDRVATILASIAGIPHIRILFGPGCATHHFPAPRPAMCAPASPLRFCAVRTHGVRLMSVYCCSTFLCAARRCFQRVGTYLCPVRGEPMGSPVVTSQILTVLSSLHETSFLPVGSKPTQLTSLPIAEK